MVRKYEYQASIAAGGYNDQRDHHRLCLLCLCLAQALTFSKEIFGDGSVEMVPPYLLLSEANLGLGRLQSTEEFLSLANWSIVKSPQCRNAIRSQVVRRLCVVIVQNSNNLMFDRQLSCYTPKVLCLPEPCLPLYYQSRS